jgi:hypothetical protein
MSAEEQPNPAVPADLGGLSDEQLQGLLVAVVKTYAERAADGLAGPFPPGLTDLQLPTPTEVLVVISDLLRATDIELFELGMWQTWGSVRSSEAPA